MNLRFSKKAIAMAAALTVIALGATVPGFVQAADQKDCPGFHQRHQMSPEQMAEKMSAHLGISQADFTKYQASGLNHRDIGHAAFLAKISGKTINEVISLKTKDNTWKDVTSTLGITTEQIKSARHNMMADRITEKTGADKNVVLDLLSQGYHGRDIMMASQLAKNTNKQIGEVLSLKKINNTWRDVATELGISQETMKEFRGMHHRHME
jgi:FixJ family two-component response regulator